MALSSADAMEYVLTDPDRLFSNAEGWETLKVLFPGGLMLRDFDDHRAHRRLMQTAFRKPAMDAYLTMMAPALARMLRDWPLDTPFDFYAAIKELTLRVGAHVFMGLALDDPSTDALNRAFIAEVDAAVTVIQKPLPFTKRRRGVNARLMLTDHFRKMIAKRRAGDGLDFFSQMCRATDDDGKGWTDQEIVDHFNFLLMAAHDTTASALTTMVQALCEHPDWQDRLADECAAVPELTPETLDDFPLTDRVFREALRLMPPVQITPRRALRDFEWRGHAIPAGTYVSVQNALIQRDPAFWTNPDDFDPDRFSENRAEDRSHRFAWAPFGGGAHKCIGMHFSTMQVKAFCHALLPTRRIARADSGEIHWKRMPIPRPDGGLRVVLALR
ncbi:cytochrome P450 [Sagittula sp. S175]|uniref:cytochrome P450 n=1 Tax=Sagittula sp. S175 TaxID=3415129 RepID=UPI003C798797